ncbi:hypothetical protein MRX96_041522 [Rhipicephalus microplus]
MAPQITKQPESRSAKPGHKVDFKATATGSPAPDITWYKDGRPVSSTIGDIVVSTTPVSQEEVTTTLTISNVTVEDAGKYSCVATNCWGARREHSGGKEPPRFIEQLEPVAATDGSPAILRCVVVGSLPIHIKWFQNRREVKDTKDFQMHYDPQTGLVSLTIPEIYPDDQGLYTCRAFNEYGQDETSAAVTVVDVEFFGGVSDVSVQPRFVQPLRPMAYPEGEPARLSVEVHAVPNPDFFWFFEGKMLKSSRDFLVTSEGLKSSLVIAELFPEDAGPYECRAQNPAGRATTSANLRVIQEQSLPTSPLSKVGPSAEPSEIRPESPPESLTQLKPPFFTRNLVSQTVVEGSPVTFVGEVTSFPEVVSFTWYLNGKAIKSSRDFQIYNEGNRTTLMIAEVFPDDAGTFSVTAENPVGIATSKAKLTVEEESVEGAAVEAPRFLTELTPVTVMDGGEAKLSVYVTGKPQPRVTWLHNDREVKENSDVWTTQRTDGYCELFISEAFPEDMGEYICKAVNIAGTAVTRTHINVESYEYVPDSEAASATYDTPGTAPTHDHTQEESYDTLDTMPSVSEMDESDMERIPDLPRDDGRPPRMPGDKHKPRKSHHKRRKKTASRGSTSVPKEAIPSCYEPVQPWERGRRKTSDPGSAPVVVVPLEDVIVPLGQPAT